MFKFKVKECAREDDYNNGMYAQARVDYTLTEKIRKPDSISFDKGSDIPELRISVKAERFTLATNVNGTTVDEQIADYLSRVHSTGWVFVSKSGYGYGMNKAEFTEFLKIGCRASLSDTSGKRGEPKQKVVRGSEEAETGKIGKFFASYNPVEVTIAEAIAIFKSF